MAIGVRSRCCHEKAAYALQSKQRQIFQLCNLLSFDLIQACLNRVLDILHPDIRMRDDGNNTLKRIKQQTIALCTRHGKQYDGKSYWTKRHLYWLEGLDFGNGVLNEVLKEYLVLYYQAQEKVETYDKRIEELSRSETYREPVEKLGCFIGIPGQGGCVPA